MTRYDSHVEKQPEFRCFQFTAQNIDGLGLSWPESICLIDPRELKPVGFICVLVIRKFQVAMGRRSEILNLESQFLTGPPPRLSWIPQNLSRAIIYWHLFCFPRHSGSRSKPWPTPSFLPLTPSSGFPPFFSSSFIVPHSSLVLPNLHLLVRILQSWIG
jgi:hypothetical protein